MKKIYALVLIVCLLLSSLLGGCQSSYNKKLHSSATNEDGMTIYLKDNVISPDASFIIAIFENPTDNMYFYGQEYAIERQTKDGQWEEVPFDGEIGFLEMAMRLEDHDIIWKSFGLKHLQEPVSEGIYRVMVQSPFEAQLEFEIRKGGVIPEKTDELDLEKQMSLDMSDPPKLEKNWQWYRMWSFVRYFNVYKEYDYRCVPGENGLVAFVHLPRQDDLDMENTKGYLCIVDRKTGKMYEVFEEPSVLYTNVEVHGDGFRCTCDDGTYEIQIINGELVVKKV